MYRGLHRLLLLAALLLLPAKALRGQDFLLGLFQSPKGVGITAVFDHGGEMDLFTLRTDFCGLLSGRTAQIGGIASYSHDYVLLYREMEDFAFSLHAGAGVMAGWVHDFENGFFSVYDRQMTHNPGIAAGATGNVGLRVDFARNITLDLSFSVCPGIHLRTNKSTGALITSFYKGGLYRAYFPQLNLFYRF